MEELPPEELYKLQKLKLLTELQDDLLHWAKRKISIVITLVTVVGVFGIGGYINLIVGDKIEKEMGAVDETVISAVQSTVEAELSAKQATQFAEKERKRLTDSANALQETIERIMGQARDIENRLEKLSSATESKSANIRGEARMLASTLEKRMENLEKVIKELADATSSDLKQQVTQDVDAAQKEANQRKSRYLNNSQYIVQIVSSKKDIKSVEAVRNVLRKEGYNVEIYPVRYTDDTFNDLVYEDWRLDASQLAETVTILHAEGEDKKASEIAQLITDNTAIKNVGKMVDNLSGGKAILGIVIATGINK